ncbi:UDP-N-acetylglucosamine 4,6-dehydratase (inverting) [Puniceicoccaceae bacterium K14]|nr:UDP-N-acetylglucosamine 4,6-dehydratase (inverting) [Puniceicoccaceae bacterium K14]
MLEGKTILITGGTGSFGKSCCREILENHNPSKVIVFSRDELKQSEMAASPEFNSKKLRFFLGDVRDKDRLKLAMTDVDIVIHAAALKQVPAAEYNPHEFIKTNINGAMNVVEASLDQGVKRVIALSTDKAVNPINLYGATKLCSDKIFIAGNSYSGRRKTRYSVVRYGNVVGSRGSVIPLFLKQKEEGKLTITKSEMTRFLITLNEGVNFVLQSLEDMSGGEIFIPKMPSCTIGDLATAIAPEAKIVDIGLRPGEKMHEGLVPSDEWSYTIEQKNRFIIEPANASWNYKRGRYKGSTVPERFSYDSENNAQRINVEQIRNYISSFIDEFNQI